MSDQEKECGKCPEGQVLKDGKCVLPEVTFTAFVMSLNTAALFHFGELADPETGRTSQDLMLAKHTIDTLKLLQEKTTGNLTRDEENLLETVLYDLKLRYVKAVG
jgi:hypothetical protein